MTCTLLVAGLALALPQPPAALLPDRMGSVRILEDGALGRRQPPPARSTTHGVWRLRVYVAREVVVRDGTATTVLRLGERVVATVRRALARLNDRVRRATGARLEISSELRTHAGRLELAPRAGRTFLAPSREDPLATDGRDVDGVLLVWDPGHLDLPMLAGTHPAPHGPHGAAGTGLAWVESRLRTPDDVARVLLHEFVHQLEELLRERVGMAWMPGPHDAAALGYRDEAAFCEDLLGRLVPSGSWSKLSARMAPLEVSRGTSRPDRPWARFADDAWRRLPRLDDNALAMHTGIADLRVQAVPGRIVVQGAPVRRTGPDAVLELERESVAVVPFGHAGAGRLLVLARFDVADLWARRLAGTAPRVLGVVLPMRAKGFDGIRESGGTATPLLALETDAAVTPTELGLLETPGGGIRVRLDEPLVAGHATALRVEGRHARSARTQPPLPRLEGGGFELRPARPGAVAVDVVVPGHGRLPFRARAAPAVSMRLRAVSGPLLVARDGAPLVLELHSHLARPLEGVVLRAQTTPGLRLEGEALRGALRLPARGRLRVELRARARPAPPAMTTLDLAAVGPSGRVLGGLRRGLLIAAGAAVAGLDLSHPPTTVGDWTARVVDDRFGRRLRLEDGGGSRFGGVVLRSADLPPFDPVQFAWLTLRLRVLRAPARARLALVLRTRDRRLVVPILGPSDPSSAASTTLPRAHLEPPRDGWARLVYPLEELLSDLRRGLTPRIGEVRLGDPRVWSSNRFPGADPLVVEVAEFAIRRERPRSR